MGLAVSLIRILVIVTALLELSIMSVFVFPDNFIAQFLDELWVFSVLLVLGLFVINIVFFAIYLSISFKKEWWLVGFNTFVIVLFIWLWIISDK